VAIALEASTAAAASLEATVAEGGAEDMFLGCRSIVV
jgi:hypothetical protein